MPWDELKQVLTAEAAQFTTADPLWKVKGKNEVSFRAHPAFLDGVRLGGDLPALVSGKERVLGAALGRWRVTLDSHLDEVPAVRTALGLAGNRFTTVEEEIVLLRYNDSARSLPGGANPVIAAAGTAFADRRQAATVHDFTQLHSFFLTAVNSFGAPYDAKAYPGRVDAMYALAAGAPAAATAGRLPLGSATDWQSHQRAFAQAVHDAAARLNFGTANALLGHALKHVLRGQPQIPGDQDGVHALIATYLKETREKITATPVDAVTSALAQTGASRTYYFGVVNQHATMVAVGATGDAWITTYYAPSRT